MKNILTRLLNFLIVIFLDIIPYFIINLILCLAAPIFNLWATFYGIVIEQARAEHGKNIIPIQIKERGITIAVTFWHSLLTQLGLYSPEQTITIKDP